MPSVRLGEWLVRRSLITRSDLFQAINVAHKRGYRLGDALVEMGVVPRDQMEQETSAMPRLATPPPIPADALRSRGAV